MKDLSAVSASIFNFIDRYGITLSEIPGRFKQKVLNQEIDKEAVELVFLPLEKGLLATIRRRTSSLISEDEWLNLLIEVSSLDNFDEEQAKAVLLIWAKAFGLKNLNEDGTLCFEDKKVSEVAIEEKYDVEISPIEEEIVDEITIQEPPSLSEVPKLQIETPPALEEPIVEEKIEFVDEKIEDTVTIVESPSAGDPFAIGSQKTFGNFAPPSLEQTKKQNRKKKSKHDFENSIEGAFKALSFHKEDLSAKIMMDLAKKGDIRAQFHLGEFYLDGTGVDKNKEKALYWLRKASVRGSFPAKQKIEDIEKEEEGCSCSGCLLIILVILIVEKLISML